MKVGAAILILFSASISPAVQAFVVNSRLASGGPPVVRLNAVGPNENDVSTTGRREMLGKLAGVFVVGIMKGSQPAVAADTAAAGRTIWNTGKSPIVPGQKPKDKGDVSGTRKDPGFLRALSDCKTQCEITPAADGYARSKEDCLSDCQDICCKTYEQCTFAITPR
mmetsp:Transcript_539/g.939  ORF Transcript_539/g.939 Transcript_539/m.939 type:complete len:166 (-) Transcript_539:818-1315(-)